MGVLEDPDKAPEEFVFSRSVSPMQAPDEPELIALQFAKGDPVALNGKPLSPASLLAELNRLGGKQSQVSPLDDYEASPRHFSSAPESARALVSARS